MFSDPGYLAATTGLKVTEDRKSVVADRNRGIQFKVNPPRNGVLNDAMFDKFKCLSVGVDGKEGKSTYDEGTIADKKAREESRKLMITQNGFRYSSPGKKATGLGGTQGCFSAFKADEVKEGKRKDDGPKKKDPEPRNILTSPGKRGTYGFPGTTLGKGEEFTYKDADEKGKKKKEKPEKEPKAIGPAFKAACKSVDFFDGHPNVPASKIYTIEEKFLPKVKKDPPPKKPLIAAPFKPSSPGKVGVQGTLAKFEHGAKEGDKPVKPKKHEEEKKPSVVWKPTATAHSLPVKSIAYNSTAINASIIRHG